MTTLVLFCDEGASLSTIQEWLEKRGKGVLLELNSAFGGTKHPEIGAYGAAYNMFDNEGFAMLFMSLTWEFKKEVLLVMRPQDGPILVYRPD